MLRALSFSVDPEIRHQADASGKFSYDMN